MLVGSIEEVIDKAILVNRENDIDPLVATFYRNLAFFFFICLGGILEIFGSIKLAFSFHFILLALIWPFNSLAYDYFLRNVEVSRFNGFLYTLPVFFIFVDGFFFEAHYGILQIVGVFALVAGAVFFSIDFKNKKLVLTRQGLGWLLLKMLAYIYLLIVFKMMGDSVNEISFYFNAWLWVLFSYTLILLWTKKYQLLGETGRCRGFLLKTLLSKSCDFFSSIFYLQAQSLVSLTILSSFTSFSPVVTLTVVIAASLIFKINLKEQIAFRDVMYKAFATALLVIGGFFIFV